MELEKEVYCYTCKSLIKQADTYAAKGSNFHRGYEYYCAACGSYIPELKNKKPRNVWSQAEQKRLQEQEITARAKAFDRDHSPDEVIPELAKALASVATWFVKEIYRCPDCNGVRLPYEQINGEWHRLAWHKAVEIALEPGWPAAACRNCQTLWTFEQKPTQAAIVDEEVCFESATPG